MKFMIENYENMTPEEKVAALEAYEPDMSGYVAKATFDKTSSELAATKKTIREKMTEDEAKKAQEADERARLLARVEELEREKTVNSYITSYLAMGYDEKLAKSSAEAMANGDTKTVFENQKKYSEAREKALRTELLQMTPTPPSGETDKGITLDKFRKMSLSEKAKFAAENPDVYDQLYGGN
jgi:hypothetical protein